MSDIHTRLRGDIQWVLLNRPPLNPLTIDMLEKLSLSLHQAIKRLPRLIVITGMGERAFCNGVDLPSDSEEQRTELLRAAKGTEMAFDELHLHNIPIIGLIKGSAFGAGCELVSLCDTVIAREDATFRLPAISAKVFPNAVSIRLPAIIGREETNRLIQDGKTLNAHEAWRLGLVQQVVATRRFVLDVEELLVMLAATGRAKQ